MTKVREILNGLDVLEETKIIRHNGEYVVVATGQLKGFTKSIYTYFKNSKVAKEVQKRLNYLKDIK